MAERFDVIYDIKSIAKHFGISQEYASMNVQAMLFESGFKRKTNFLDHDEYSNQYFAEVYYDYVIARKNENNQLFFCLESNIKTERIDNVFLSLFKQEHYSSIPKKNKFNIHYFHDLESNLKNIDPKLFFDYVNKTGDSVNEKYINRIYFNRFERLQYTDPITVDHIDQKDWQTILWFIYLKSNLNDNVLNWISHNLNMDRNEFDQYVNYSNFDFSKENIHNYYSSSLIFANYFLNEIPIKQHPTLMGYFS